MRTDPLLAATRLQSSCRHVSATYRLNFLNAAVFRLWQKLQQRKGNEVIGWSNWCGIFCSIRGQRQPWRKPMSVGCWLCHILEQTQLVKNFEKETEEETASPCKDLLFMTSACLDGQLPSSPFPNRVKHRTAQLTSSNSPMISLSTFRHSMPCFDTVLCR